MGDACPTYSFVLPAYNEEANLEAMTARLLETGRQLDGSFEVIWVNDGSTDGTAKVLDRLAEQYGELRPVHLSRNFGHMAALTAGLECARASNAVITLDGDGQHPPELIPRMLEKWREGADIVQMLRQSTPDETALKRATSRGFYRLINFLSETHIPEGAADFRLLDRGVVDTLNGLPERVRFLRGLVHWVGFETAHIPYQAEKRSAGETKYSFFKMLAFALSGIVSFSIRPLRLAFFVGAAITFLAFLYAVYIVYCYLTGVALVPGWTSMLLALLVLSGVQLLTIGIASEYLAQLFLEQKHRPIYIVRTAQTRDRHDSE